MILTSRALGRLLAKVDAVSVFPTTDPGDGKFWLDSTNSLVAGPPDPLTFPFPLTRTDNVVSLPAASAGQSGYLSAANWVTFNSKADLVGGKLPVSQLPSIAIVEHLGVVADEPGMLALVGEQGDFCTRSDLGTNWQIVGPDPTDIGDWLEMVYPVATWGSVVGTLSAQGDLQSALDAKLPLAGGTMTGNLNTAAGVDVVLSDTSELKFGSGDVVFYRYAPTSAAIMGADGGLRVRNALNTADAPLTASYGTFSNNVTAPSVIVGDGTATHGTLVVKNTSEDLLLVDNTDDGRMRLNATGSHGQYLEFKARDPSLGGLSGIESVGLAFHVGSAAASFTGSGSEFTIKDLAGNPIVIKPHNPTAKAMVVRGAASQTANLQEWQNSASTVLASVSPAGNVTAPSVLATNGGASALRGTYNSSTNSSSNSFRIEGVDAFSTTFIRLQSTTANNVLIGGLADDGTNKLQVTGSAAFSNNVTAPQFTGQIGNGTFPDQVGHLGFFSGIRVLAGSSPFVSIDTTAFRIAGAIGFSSSGNTLASNAFDTRWQRVSPNVSKYVGVDGTTHGQIQVNKVVAYDTSGNSRGVFCSPSWSTDYVAIQNTTLAESVSNVALAQGPAGATQLNAASGQDLTLRTGYATRATINADNAAFVVPVKITANNNAGGLQIHGTTNPAISFFTGGAGKGYIGLTTANAAWFSNAIVNDITIRADSAAARVLVGVGGLSSSELTIADGATTVAGTLTLGGAPTADLHAATKLYVDDSVAAVDLSTKVSKSGDTMTGPLTLNAGVTIAGQNLILAEWTALRTAGAGAAAYIHGGVSGLAGSQVATTYAGMIFTHQNFVNQGFVFRNDAGTSLFEIEASGDRVNVGSTPTLTGGHLRVQGSGANRSIMTEGGIFSNLSGATRSGLQLVGFLADAGATTTHTYVGRDETATTTFSVSKSGAITVSDSLTFPGNTGKGLVWGAAQPKILNDGNAQLSIWSNANIAAPAMRVLGTQAIEFTNNIASLANADAFVFNNTNGALNAGRYNLAVKEAGTTVSGFLTGGGGMFSGDVTAPRLIVDYSAAGSIYLDSDISNVILFKSALNNPVINVTGSPGTIALGNGKLGLGSTHSITFHSNADGTGVGDVAIRRPAPNTISISDIAGTTFGTLQAGRIENPDDVLYFTSKSGFDLKWQDDTVTPALVLPSNGYIQTNKIWASSSQGSIERIGVPGDWRFTGNLGVGYGNVQVGSLLAMASYTDASNYSRASLAATTTDITLSADVAGTHSADNVNIVLSPAGSGNLLVQTSAGSFGVYPSGGSSTNLTSSGTFHIQESAGSTFIGNNLSVNQAASGSRFAGRLTVGASGIRSSMLSVNGGVSIGTTFIETLAPTNGMIVQGNVGIGTASPAAILHSAGTASYPALKIDQWYNQTGVDISHSANGTALNLTHTGYGSGIKVNKTTNPLSIANQIGFDLDCTFAHTHPSSAELGKGMTIDVTNNSVQSGAVLFGIDMSVSGSGAGTVVRALDIDATATSGTAYAIYAGAGQNYFAGKVGIGTEAPAASLDIVGDTAVAPILQIGTTSRVGGTLFRLADSFDNTMMQVNDYGRVGFGSTIAINENYAGDASDGNNWLKITGSNHAHVADFRTGWAGRNCLTVSATASDFAINSLSGKNSFAGEVLLGQEPTTDAHAATKLYVDTAAAAAGNVFKVGTPVDNQIGVWTGDGTLEGDAGLTWDGTKLLLADQKSIRSEYFALNTEIKFQPSGNFISYLFNGNELMRMRSSDIRFTSTKPITWASGASDATAADLFIYRGAANTLYQRNSTNAQTYLLSGSYTDTSNYSRASLAATTTDITLSADVAGTHSADNVNIVLTPAGSGSVQTNDIILNTDETQASDGVHLLNSVGSELGYFKTVYGTSRLHVTQVNLTDNNNVWHTNYLGIGFQTYLGFASAIYSAPTTKLYGNVANTLYQRNSTNAQTYLLSGSYTDASNYSRASLAATTTDITLSADVAGTHASDNVNIVFTPAGTGAVEQRNGTNGQTLRIAKTWTSSTNHEYLDLDATTDPSYYRIGSRVGSAGGTTRGLEFGRYNSANTWQGWISLAESGLSILSGGVDGRGFRAGSTFTQVAGASYGSFTYWYSGLIQHTAASSTFSGDGTFSGNIYKNASYTNASNYSRAKLAATTTDITLSADVAGTHASDNVNIVLSPVGTGKFIVESSNYQSEAFIHSTTVGYDAKVTIESHVGNQLVLRSSGAGIGKIEHQGTSRIEFPFNVQRTDIKTDATFSGNVTLGAVAPQLTLGNDGDQYIAADSTSNWLKIFAGNQERVKFDSAGSTFTDSNGQLFQISGNGSTVYDTVSDRGQFKLRASGSNRLVLALSSSAGLIQLSDSGGVQTELRAIGTSFFNGLLQGPVTSVAPGSNTYAIQATALLGRNFGLFVRADGNEGGVMADSQLQLFGENGILITPKKSVGDSVTLTYDTARMRLQTALPIIFTNNGGVKFRTSGDVADGSITAGDATFSGLVKAQRIEHPTSVNSHLNLNATTSYVSSPSAIGLTAGSNTTFFYNSGRLVHAATGAVIEVEGTTGYNDSTPPYTFASDTNTGFSNPVADNIEVICGGSAKGRFQTNGLQLPLGSVTGPALGFMADAHTGMYWVENDSIGFTTGGVNAITIDASQNVSIGTLTPTARLHVLAPVNGSLPAAYMADNTGFTNQNVAVVSRSTTLSGSNVNALQVGSSLNLPAGTTNTSLTNIYSLSNLNIGSNSTIGGYNKNISAHLKTTSGTGTISGLTGIEASFEGGGGAVNVTSMSLMKAGLGVYGGSGNFTTVKLFEAVPGVPSGHTGAVTNLYGLYIGDIDARAAANGYAIYSVSGANYFGGDLEVAGDVTLAGAPTADLHAATKLYVDTVAAAAGGVSKVGTPVDNQIGVWTGDGTLEGDAGLTWDGASNLITATNARVTGDLYVGAASNSKFSSADNTNLYVNAGGLTLARFTASTLSLDSNAAVAWHSAQPWSGNNEDTFLRRGAAGTLYQRNSTNAQTYLLSGSYTDASNYSRAKLAATTTDITLSADVAGTHAADNVNIVLTPAGTGNVAIGGAAQAGNKLKIYGSLKVAGSASIDDTVYLGVSSMVHWAGGVNFQRNNTNGSLVLTTQNFAGASFIVANTNAATVPQVIKGAASQTANLQEWQDSSSVVKASISPTGSLSVGASTTAQASLNIPAGIAPTVPVEGDVWYDGTNFKARNSTTTISFGDLVGPASATDNALVRFDGTTGKLVQGGSTVTLSDSGAFSSTGVMQFMAGTNIGLLAGAVYPMTINSVDLGTTTLRYKVGYINTVEAAVKVNTPLIENTAAALTIGNATYGVVITGGLQVDGGTLVDSGSADATISDVASGYATLWKNTTTGKTNLVQNDGGTIRKSIPLTNAAASTGWAVSNYTTRKTFDPTTDTLTDLMDLVCTLVDRIKTLEGISA